MAGDWVNYANETNTRMVAVSSIGSADTVEKDLIAGDVNRDGAVDLIVVRKVRFSNPGGLANVLFLNNHGTMEDRTSTYIPGFADLTDDRDVALVDVDVDGWLDIVTVTTFSHQPRVYMNRGADLNGTWLGFAYVEDDHRIPDFLIGPKFCAVGTGDVTGNGFPDLFFVDYDNDLEDRLLINDGTGFFTDETAARMTAAMSESVFGTDSHIADMNGDGFLDIVKNSASGNNAPPGATPPAVRILYNDGTGNFTSMDSPYTESPYMVELGDLNQDGRLDFYVVDDGQDSYLYNTGNAGPNNHAQFSRNILSSSPGTEDFGGNTKIADLDGDGILDILVTDVDTDIAGCDRRMVILRGEGTAPAITYSDPLNGASREWLPTGTFDVEIFDIDHDGNQDIWAGICDGNRIFMGQGPGIFVDGAESGDFSWWSETAGL
jgi:hypothetical protein